MSPKATRRVALVLLMVTIAFRLWAVPFARFTGDESDYWYKSRQVAVGAYRPVYGPEITGSAARLPGPAYYYLMAVPQTLGASPYLGSAFVVVLHGLAAWLLFLLTSAARSPRAGLLALALVAFAPWDVLYADRIWGSCVVPVWGALAVFAAAKSRERPAWMGLMVFLALVLPQLHLSVPVLWATCIILLGMNPPSRWPWRWIALGTGLAVLAYLPPLIAELNSNFSNTRAILTHGGGRASWRIAATAPLKVFGYAWLYATSEIGYHWARGYWGGGFSEAAAYFSQKGLRHWWGQHGTGLALAHLTSIAVAGLGWGTAIARMIRYFRSRRARDPHSVTRAEAAMTTALFGGLVVASTLLLLARKTYFPHYANILMPMFLMPVAIGLDVWLDRARAKWVVAIAIATSMGAMALGTIRYYRQVDALNGLGPTLSMVAQVADDEPAARIRFTYFNNSYAWRRLAQAVYNTDLPGRRADVQYTVHNRTAFTGNRPTGGTLHGPTLLVRRPPDAQTSAMAPKLKWTTIDVEAVFANGQRRRCRRFDAGCRYGAEPWQKLEPTTMMIGGKARPVLFMHPIAGGTVRARIPVPGKTGQTAPQPAPNLKISGHLEYALSDSATRSTNRAPVEVAIRDSQGRLLARGQADNRPGLRKLPFTTTSSAGWIDLEIQTKRDGARVFGFDLSWR